MQKIQVLQPEMKKIQERYKDDKQRMNQEMMKFYQENKVNPLGSCLPLALQMPFFISLFQLLRSADFKADIAGDESFLFIPDMAGKLTDQPAVLAFMIVLYVGTQLAASLITTVGGDKNQQRIMLALPFFFVPLIASFPAGPDPLLGDHELLDDRPAARGPQALPQAASMEKEPRRPAAEARQEAGASPPRWPTAATAVGAPPRPPRPRSPRARRRSAPGGGGSPLPMSADEDVPADEPADAPARRGGAGRGRARPGGRRSR